MFCSDCIMAFSSKRLAAGTMSWPPRSRPKTCFALQLQRWPRQLIASPSLVLTAAQFLVEPAQSLVAKAYEEKDKVPCCWTPFHLTAGRANSSPRALISCGMPSCCWREPARALSARAWRGWCTSQRALPRPGARRQLRLPAHHLLPAAHLLYQAAACPRGRQVAAATRRLARLVRTRAVCGRR